MDSTSHMSFKLGVSPLPDAGIGVFALHDIDANVWLALKPVERIGIDRPSSAIPAELLVYCLDNGDGTFSGPPEFNHPHLIWFVNHSTTPNAELRADGYCTTRYIHAGEELLIDYAAIGQVPPEVC